MSVSICVAQSVKELEFILKNLNNKEVICLPINLSTHLFCVENNLKFYNPINFLNNDFHENALIESENFLNQLKFGDLKFSSHIKEYKAFMRFKFFSAVFLVELIEKINIKKKIDKIIVSGWSTYSDQYSKKNYFVSYLLENLINNIKVTKLTNSDDNQISSREKKRYLINNKNLDKKVNYILLTNIGYNFIKFVFFFKKKNYHILVPVFEKVNFLRKILMKIFNLTFVEFKTFPDVKKEKFEIPKINFLYKGKDFSKILNDRKEQEVGNLMKLKNRSEVVDSLFEKANIKLVITNVTRGIHGYFVEKAKEKKIPSVCIPHGTLAGSFNKFDKIYKKIIAEAITIEDAEFFAAQSKITKDFIISNNIKNKSIETGNLIFSESKSTKKKILYAVTYKGFENFQYLGVEMFYEFIDNLNLLNNIARERNLEIIVKPHPEALYCFDKLKKIYKNLEFTKKRIDNVLKDAFVTISFSSTVIEDSLYSNIPVILLDRWKRYKHCKSEENIKKKNSAIYYVNNENDLIECINTITNSHEIFFGEHIFEGNSKLNIKKLIENIL